ncbi:unnamed protein product [Allacma fusca]|uniref:BED-type domain-containing protein n=1 Tax=Allacma fusca TaxID=39272 RepID=A0A8J2NYI1_9HEXA|nr:unnamed protein product [Allacma fusca]
MRRRVRPESKASVSSESMDKNFKITDYSETTVRASKVWKHYLRRSDGRMALCKLCQGNGPPKLIPTKDYHTTGLVTHLECKHQISLGLRTPNSAPVADAGQLVNPPIAPAGFSVTLTDCVTTRFTNYFKSVVTMDSLIAELVAKDGISFRTIVKSKVLRRLFRAEFGDLPKCHTGINNRFTKFYSEIKSKKTQEIHQYVQAGMERIPGTFAAADCLYLVEKRAPNSAKNLKSSILDAHESEDSDEDNTSGSD